MTRNVPTTVLQGVGATGTLAGLLILLQLPAANQYHETTLAATGIAVYLVLFGIKTLTETRQ